MSKQILLLDDDHGPMDYYKDAMVARDMEVRHVDSVDEFMKLLAEPDRTSEFATLVVDLMLPYGESFSHETSNGGLSTGLLVIQEARARMPELPIIVLTNHSNPDVVSAIPRDIPVVFKFECSPFEFADMLQKTTGSQG